MDLGNVMLCILIANCFSALLLVVMTWPRHGDWKHPLTVWTENPLHTVAVAITIMSTYRSVLAVRKTAFIPPPPWTAVAFAAHLLVTLLLWTVLYGYINRRANTRRRNRG